MELLRFRDGFYSSSSSGRSGGAFDGSRFDEVIVTSFLLEKLSEMVFAVQDPFKRCVVRWRDRTASVRTLEARLVVTLALHGYLLDRVHCFTASSAFILRSREHSSNSARCSCLRTRNQEEN